MSRVYVIIALSFFTLFSCKSTKKAISETENKEEPEEPFMEGMVEEIDETEPSDTRLEEMDTDILDEETAEVKWSDKIIKGIDFFATGAGPFWSLEMDYEDHIHFISSSLKDSLSIPFAEPGSENKSNVVFVTSDATNGMRITVKDTTCKDYKSGEILPYSVLVNVKQEGAKTYSQYSGCGDFLGDLKLDGEWKIVKFNDDTVVKTNEMARAPFITFSLADESIMGYAGCNTMNGSFDFGYKVIKFSKLTQTRMQCPNMDLENEVIKAFADKTYSYSINGENLLLKNTENTLQLIKIID